MKNVKTLKLKAKASKIKQTVSLGSLCALYYLLQFMALESESKTSPQIEYHAS